MSFGKAQHQRALCLFAVLSHSNDLPWNNIFPPKNGWEPDQPAGNLACLLRSSPSHPLAPRGKKEEKRKKKPPPLSLGQKFSWCDLIHPWKVWIKQEDVRCAQQLLTRAALALPLFLLSEQTPAEHHIVWALPWYDSTGHGVTFAGLFALVLGVRWRKLDTIINSDLMPRGASRNLNLNLKLQKTQL